MSEYKAVDLKVFHRQRFITTYTEHQIFSFEILMDRNNNTYRIQISRYFRMRRTKLHFGFYNTDATSSLLTHYLGSHGNSFLT